MIVIQAAWFRRGFQRFEERVNTLLRGENWSLESMQVNRGWLGRCVLVAVLSHK